MIKLTVAVDQVLSALADRDCDPVRSGDTWSAVCPGCAGQLSVAIGDAGRPLLQCKSKCGPASICSRLDLCPDDVLGIQPAPRPECVPTVEAKPAGRNNATVIVSLGDDVLECRTLNLTKPKDRNDLVESVCNGRDGIDRDALKMELIRSAAYLSKPAGDPPPDNGRGDQELLLAEMPESVRAEAKQMLTDPDLLKRIVDDIASIGVAGEKTLTATIYLVGTSRLLPSPLSAIVKGPSASGKSYLIRKTASLFPPEGMLEATQQTPQSLFYMPPGALSHRFIVGSERSRLENDDSAEATRALREMISGGRLSKLIPVKDGGKMVTTLVEQDGPIAFIESTTLTNIFEEDANRCILLHTDEQDSQTRRIIDRLAASHSGSGTSGETKRIIDRHHAAQRMLRPLPVVIPYAQRLGKLFGSERVEARRAFPHVLSMIQASALLHQYQRSLDDQERLIATEDDYQLCRHLLVGPMARLLGGRMSEPARRFQDRLAKRFKVGEAFTSSQAKKGESSTGRAVNGWLTELLNVGAVELVEASRGPKPAVWRRTDGVEDPGDRTELPTMDDLFPSA